MTTGRPDASARQQAGRSSSALMCSNVAGKAASKPSPEGFSARVYGLSKWLLRMWARVWLRFSLEGRQFVPRDGAVLAVGNHASYLDPPLLACGLPRPVLFLAKKELANFAPLRYGTGPRGPAFHKLWRQPIATVLAWPPAR